MPQTPDREVVGAPPGGMTPTAAALAIIAHELRNPIGAIRCACRAIEGAGKLPEVMQQAHQVIVRQAAQLAVLVDDLLQLPFLSEGPLRLRRAWIDVIPEVQAAVEACAWAFRAARHDLSVEIPMCPVYADVDGPRLRQALINLLDNACKYTPASGRVKISLCALEGSAVFKVQDNGRGIKSDSLADLFKLFRRLPGEFLEGAAGLGIGLALVHEIATRHGGEVWAASAGPGCGSTFVMRLPVHRWHTVVTMV
jgi:signal transduction histidine kinase